MSNKVVHTKGPWIAKARFGQKIKIVHTDTKTPGAASGVIAEVTCRQSWIAEQEANARLIAAAPELLKAAEMMVLSGWENEPAVILARAAIDKAKGR